MNIFKNIVEDAKSLLRGERRVGKGMRGRVFKRKNGEGDLLAPKAKGKLTIEAIVIDDSFNDLKLLQRQRLVYDAVGHKIKNGQIHALSLKTYSKSDSAVK